MAVMVTIRHADAGRRERWQGDDRLRPLGKKGRRQAEALARTLADENAWYAGPFDGDATLMP